MASKLLYFLSYSLIFTLYGTLITSIGPVIPFFTQTTGKPETYFSFIFLWRAIGYILGGYVAKILFERINLHQVIILSVSVGGVSYMVSTMSFSFWNLSLSFFVGGACCCMITVCCNVCVIKLYPKNQDYWVQLLQTLFGIGGLAGPFIVAIFKDRSYFVLGAILLMSTPLFYIFSSPQNRQSARKSQMGKPITVGVQIMLSSLFVLYVGLQVGFGSWVSSYAVMEGIATPEQAAYTSLIFWITNTIFRVILVYVTLKISARLKILLSCMMMGCIINLIAALTEHQWFAAYIGSFLNGMFLASLFALYLTLPSEFGYKLSKKNTTNFMMSASLGEGILAMPIGYSMGFYGPWMLYGIELIFAIISWILVRKITEIFQIASKANYLTQQEEEFSSQGSQNKLPY